MNHPMEAGNDRKAMAWYLRMIPLVIAFIGGGLPSYMQAQYPRLPVDVDSLRQLLTTRLDDTTRTRVNINLCLFLMHSNRTEAMGYGRTGLELARRIEVPGLIVSGLTILGESLQGEGRYADAMQLYQEAYHVADSAGDGKRMVKALVSISGAWQKQYDFANALASARDALQVLDTINDQGVKASIFSSMGNSFRGMGEFDSSNVYFKRALALAEQAGDTRTYGSATNGLGMNHFDRRDYGEAAKYYEMALDLARSLHKEDLVITSMLNAGTAYGMMGDIPKSRTYLEEAIQKSERMGDRYLQLECYNSLAEVLNKAGMYEEAFVDLRTMQRLADSIKVTENRVLVAEYETKFDTQRKEKEIEVLNLDKKVQAQNLAKEELRRNVFMGGFVIVLGFAGVFLVQRNRIKEGKRLSDELLLNILPEETANELKEKGASEAKLFDQVTVLFTDFKDFTQVAEQLSPQSLVAEIHHCFKAFDAIMEKHRIEKIKTIGDAYMAAGGLPVVNVTNATDVVFAALEIQRFIQDYRSDRHAQGQLGFDIRIGIHTGPVVAGIVGVKKYSYDIWGDTVNTASRMESSGEPGKVNISGSTYEIVKDKFVCIHRGKVQAKNKGEIDMYFVEGVR